MSGFHLSHCCQSHIVLGTTLERSICSAVFSKNVSKWILKEFPDFHISLSVMVTSGSESSYYWTISSQWQVVHSSSRQDHTLPQSPFISLSAEGKELMTAYLTVHFPWTPDSLTHDCLSTHHMHGTNPLNQSILKKSARISHFLYNLFNLWIKICKTILEKIKN